MGRCAVGCKREYDEVVKRWNPATVAASGLLLLASCLATASAQIHAAPPSVTSMGFGGRAINGAPPSVTSLGPRGFTPGFNPAFPNSHPHFGTNPGFVGHGPHHRPRGNVVYYGVPYYGSYGYYDNGYDDNASAAGSYAEQPERRVMQDRHDSYREPEPATVAENTPPPSAPEREQPDTVLVFKDGHQLEVENYAIVGQTLYDLTEGHRRKVPLSDLDLTATAKQNDDRGIDFHLPGGTEAN